MYVLSTKTLLKANVACREAGFPHGAEAFTRGSHFRQESRLDVVVADVDCRGDEVSLADCRFSGTVPRQCGRSSYNRLAGVYCKSESCETNLQLLGRFGGRRPPQR